MQWIEDEIKFLKRLNTLWDNGTIRQIERVSNLNFRSLVEKYEYPLLKLLLEWELKTVKQLRFEAQRIGVEQYWTKTKAELIGEILARSDHVRIHK